MEIVLTESTRGKSLLVVDKYSFYKQKQLKNGESFWRCTKKSANCTAKVFTAGSDNNITRSQLVHNHEPDFSKVNRQILFTECKRKAQEEAAEIPSKVVDSPLSEELPVSVNSTDIIKRNIYNYKHRVSPVVAPTIVTSDEEEIDDFNPEEQPSRSEVNNKKWQHVRDAFIKSLKKLSEQPSAKKYLYYDNLKFLIKIMQTDDTDMGKGVENHTESAPNVNCGLQRQQQFHDDAYQEILNALRTNQNQPDEDEAFFMSVLPSVRKMSDENKLEFRMGVLQLIKEINNRAKESAAVGTLLFQTTNPPSGHHAAHAHSFTHYASSSANGMTCCQHSHLA